MPLELRLLARAGQAAYLSEKLAALVAWAQFPSAARLVIAWCAPTIVRARSVISSIATSNASVALIASDASASACSCAAWRMRAPGSRLARLFGLAPRSYIAIQCFAMLFANLQRPSL